MFEEESELLKVHAAGCVLVAVGCVVVSFGDSTVKMMAITLLPGLGSLLVEIDQVRI